METSVNHEEITEGSIGERRIWLAVIILAIEDWRTGTLRARREAQTFLFENHGDFDDVCANAGLSAANLRAQLRKAGRQVEMQGPLVRPLAA